IRHLTGIPHSPTGQAIVERAHGTLKSLLQKQKEGELLPPSERLAKALYVLNYLRLTEGRDSPPIVIHHMSLQSGIQRETNAIKVLYRDLQTGEWNGP
ncbi:POK19 protein, partial [Corythaeola cristata]|nr:POK19 protein [Corythaeola cristata]